MMSWLHHIERHKSLLHRVMTIDEHWTTLLSEKHPLSFRLWLWCFLVDFYTFWTNGNRNEHLTKQSATFANHPNWVSTLPNVKQRILRTPWSTASGVHSIELVVCNFRRKPSNVHLLKNKLLYEFFYQSFGRKTFTFSLFFRISHISSKLNSKLNIFNVKK